MERLTEEKQIGPFASLKDKAEAVPGAFATYDCLYAHMVAVTRLKEYEDTGLGPEEITTEPYGCVFYCNRKCNLDGDWCAEGPGCPHEINAETAKHLLELSQAEKDGRLVVLPCDKVRWIKAILAERERQDQKFGYLQENSFCEWASILAEEVGELSKELNELNFGRGTLNQMEAEAVQVAAVALSILEQSAVAHMVTVQVAVALSRLTREEAEAALKKREEEDNEKN